MKKMIFAAIACSIAISTAAQNQSTARIEPPKKLFALEKKQPTQFKTILQAVSEQKSQRQLFLQSNRLFTPRARENTNITLGKMPCVVPSNSSKIRNAEINPSFDYKLLIKEADA